MTAAPLSLPAMPARYRQTCAKTPLREGQDALAALKRSRADVDQCNVKRSGAVSYYDTVSRAYAK